MYYLSKIYQGFKGFTAISGTTGSILAIVYGILTTGGTVFIIGGSLCLVNSIFNLIEISKVNLDIRKQIGELKTSLRDFSRENAELHNNVKSLGKIKEDFVRENRQLQTTLDESAEQLERLETLKDDYDDINQKLAAQLEEEKDNLIDLRGQNEELRSSLEEMMKIRDQFASENKQLSDLLVNANVQINRIMEIKDQYQEEINQLNQNNQVLSRQMSKQAEIIEESKKLIHSLAQFGDQYSQFSSTIDTNLIKLDTTQTNLEDTTNILNSLVSKLQTQTFNQLDIDQDGTVTKEEFDIGIQRLSQP